MRCREIERGNAYVNMTLARTRTESFAVSFVKAFILAKQPLFN